MRILYIDIDSLRPDHLGCYGYHRPTSPTIDQLAREGVRFNYCYASDVPCLPSRTSLISGRFGIHTGVVNHGGVASQPFIEGPQRGFADIFRTTSWAASMRKAGFKTVLISPFGERHAAWHFYAGFNEIYNTGKSGNERADEVSPVAIDWIKRHGKEDNWFLHMNVWDPHTPYRTPEEQGNLFKDDPTPEWLTEDVREQHWNGCGPHSAQEIPGFEHDVDNMKQHPRQPIQASDMSEVRKMFDGYDMGVHYADEHVGRILKALEDEGVLDETAIIISSDHGENLGELNIYGDHQTADEITTHVPLVVRWPGVTDGQKGRVDDSIMYANDMAATAIELAGGEVPGNWDGVSFADNMKAGDSAATRDFVVVSQNAWSCQRGVRFRHDGEEYTCVRSYHDGYHGFPDIMLFNLTDDPHEQSNIALEHEDLVGKAMSMLDEWMGQMMRTATHFTDPMWTVIGEGGPLHTRGQLPKYMERLKATGRGKWAEHLAAKHPREV